jgi:hypothetical protein
MFATGDIVGCYAPTVGYRKYHLCIFGPTDEKAGWFLFINSENNYETDFVLKNEDLDCIPKNDTGLSVISCSSVVRLSVKHLELYKAERLGSLAKVHATALVEFIKESRALTGSEKRACAESLSSVLG